MAFALNGASPIFLAFHFQGQAVLACYNSAIKLEHFPPNILPIFLAAWCPENTVQQPNSIAEVKQVNLSDITNYRLIIEKLPGVAMSTQVSRM